TLTDVQRCLDLRARLQTGSLHDAEQTQSETRLHASMLQTRRDPSDCLAGQAITRFDQHWCVKGEVALEKCDDTTPAKIATDPGYRSDRILCKNENESANDCIDGLINREGSEVGFEESNIPVTQPLCSSSGERNLITISIGAYDLA